VAPPVEAPPLAVAPALDELPPLPDAAPPAPGPFPPPAFPLLLPPLGLPLVPAALGLPALPLLAVEPPSAAPAPPADWGSPAFEVPAHALASTNSVRMTTGAPRDAKPRATERDGRRIEVSWLHARPARIDRGNRENERPKLRTLSKKVVKQEFSQCDRFVTFARDAC